MGLLCVTVTGLVFWWECVYVCVCICVYVRRCACLPVRVSGWMAIEDHNEDTDLPQLVVAVRFRNRDVTYGADDTTSYSL